MPCVMNDRCVNRRMNHRVNHRVNRRMNRRTAMACAAMTCAAMAIAIRGAYVAFAWKVDTSKCAVER